MISKINWWDKVNRYLYSNSLQRRNNKEDFSFGSKYVSMDNATNIYMWETKEEENGGNVFMFE